MESILKKVITFKINFIPQICLCFKKAVKINNLI